jgi:2-methylcitrate dehydratase
VPHSVERISLDGTIAGLARAIRAAPPPSQAAIRRAKVLLLDAIGCGLIGARAAVSRAAAKTSARSGACLVLGGGRTAALLDAVLTNGVCIRALDFNDYFVNIEGGEPETGGHPSDNIPTALAVGSVYGRSGAQILAAIVTGYELYARLQTMMDREGPWDSVCVSGIAAPAIAGCLIGLDEETMSHALALGLSRAAMPAIVRREKLSAAKTIANALIAQSGVQAALLAEAGITGPLSILDSTLGLGHVFANYDPTLLAQPLSSEGAIMRAHVKAYPCVNTGQGVVAAALALRAKLKDGLDAVSHIELIMPDYRIIARQQNDPSRSRPTTREAADHSFPFLAAVSLIDGAFGLAQFENERWRDPRVAALVEKIGMRRAVPRQDAQSYPFPCAIRAAGRNGTQYGVEATAPSEFSPSGLSESAVIGKFHGLLESILPRTAREAIVDAVVEFDQCPSAERLNTAIAKGETVT